MLRFLSLVAGAIMLASFPAAAQTSNPVLAHYRDYTAALERGDLPAAETAARAALASSEQRDGDGGSTGVLALNLAHVLLERNNPVEAAAPAQRALAIALASGPAGRVDPLVAELAVQRSALPNATSESAEQFWFALLRAHEGGARNEPVYDAASDLARWAGGRDEFDLAARAWRVASEASPGDDAEAVLARAEALRGLGSTLLLRDIARDRTVRIATLTHRPGSSEADTSPMEPLIEAVRITRPLARTPGPADALTNTQYSFAVSLALMNAARARLGSMNGWEETGRLTDWSELSGLLIARAGEESATLCTLNITPASTLRFPRDMQNRYGVGAVVVRFSLSPDGALTAAEPIASAGGESFYETVRRARWEASRRDDAAPGCAMPAVSFRSIAFVFPD
jgi:hypothetical protein